MSNKIPTAEEFIPDNNYYFVETLPGNKETCILKDDVAELMINFAKLHVQAALQEAAVYGYLREDTFGPEDIKNCYPLENIK